jgi:hypothetical protein
MKVDMSAKAVTARLKRVSQLRDLALSLGRAKPVANQSQEKTNQINTSKSNEQNNK